MAASIEKEILQHLPNFRCVYPRKQQEGDRNVVSGALFRSSRPELLSEKNADDFARSGIRTIIDCRPVKEYLTAKADSFIDKYYGIHCQPDRFPLLKTNYVPNEPVQLQQVKSLKHNLQTGSTKKHVCLDFFRMNYVLHILYMAPLRTVLKSLIYLIKDLFDFSSNYYKHFVGFFADQFFNPHGLLQQYKNMIKWSQASICAALKILSYPDSLPALINCSHGKDRTGILVMIILALMDVPREEICKDYALSEKGLLCIQDRVHYEICVRYNMAEDFKSAKPEVMRGLMEYIDEQYGSMEGYLDHIGFGAEERERLRHNLRSFSQ